MQKNISDKNGRYRLSLLEKKNQVDLIHNFGNSISETDAIILFPHSEPLQQMSQTYKSVLFQTNKTRLAKKTLGQSFSASHTQKVETAPSISVQKKAPFIPKKDYRKQHKLDLNHEKSESNQHYHFNSFKGKEAYSPKNHRIIKEDELRQTGDSMSPTNWKQRRGPSINDFQRIRQLGKGRHGTVFLARHKQTGFLGALKIYEKEQFQKAEREERLKMQQQLIRECKIQSVLNHNYIIKIYSIFSDRKHVYLFMQLGSDGQLFDVLQKKKTLKEETISFVLRWLLQAVEELHKNNIIHRDLKPENIVLIFGFPKICDFGESSICVKEKGELRQTLVGTPLYLSPEVLMGERYDQKIDIWALGALGYELFTGNNPFNITNKEQLKRIITDQFKMTNGSIELRNFMTYCLKKQPCERPTASKLLRHPFIKKYLAIEVAQQFCS